jgi:hypothetical protein
LGRDSFNLAAIFITPISVCLCAADGGGADAPAVFKDDYIAVDVVRCGPLETIHVKECISLDIELLCFMSPFTWVPNLTMFLGYVQDLIPSLWTRRRRESVHRSVQGHQWLMRVVCRGSHCMMQHPL